MANKKAAAHMFERTNDIASHLEFLGYTVEKIDDDNVDVLLAKSQHKGNLILRIAEVLTLVSSRWSGYDSKALKSKELYSTINQVNKATYVSKWYFESDEDKQILDIVIEAVYSDYQKTSFGNLVESFESETRQHLNEFQQFVIE